MLREKDFFFVEKKNRPPVNPDYLEKHDQTWHIRAADMALAFYKYIEVGIFFVKQTSVES